ncbi:MAG TPA: replication initiation factor domain-containing protein [Burkholderiales bacterium]|nr:replication initiation factor domain-containing protein [Burkholderiales bacterium]
MTPTSNTGVNKVRGLTRDERLVLEGGKVKVVCAERQQEGESGVIVDYLRFTVRRDAVLESAGPAAKGNDDDLLTAWLAFEVAGVLGFTVGEERKGRDFYDVTWTVNNEFGKEIGSASGGGANQRETFCVTLKGEGCTFACKGWERRLFDRFEGMHPVITRIDLARDYLAGEVLIEEVRHCFFTGEFSYRNRRPSYMQFGRWEPESVSHEKPNSRTFQVGQRESGKLFRAYEKGHQFKMMDDPWLRLELELRNVNRIVPFEALIRPADFFAGAYDFCQMVLDQKPVAEKIVTSQPVGERSVARVARNVENTFAPTVRMVFAALGIDKAGEFFQLLAVKHIYRKVPRGLAGLSHVEVERGFETWHANLSATVPAGCAHS